MDPKVPNTIRVAFVVEGSRGDMQPYLAVALRMQARGNVVKIFTNIDHKRFCDSLDVPTEGVFYNFSHAF
jgi:UDP:flavonoid glycosyltransferase YjiC (YdhE family)